MQKGLNNMEKKIIEQRAEKVLQSFQYVDGEDTYVDAVRLARFFGFNIEEKKNLPANEDGCITVSENAFERDISVNAFRSIEAKRFIIVHELSHFLLHYMGDKQLFRHRENTKGKNMEENDADYLAACLLMPAKSFKKQYELIKEGRPSQLVVDRLQEIFQTPRESIERRIEEVCL